MLGALPGRPRRRNAQDEARSRERKQGVPRGCPRVLKGELKSGIQAVLKVVKGAPHGTQGTRGYSKKLVPDGATAGTAVPGASVLFMGEGVGEGVVGGVGGGVGEGVAAQTNAQRWTARQKADVSTRRVPLRWSQIAQRSRTVPCTARGMWYTTQKMHSHTRA